MASTARLKWNKDMLGIVNWVNSFYEVYFSALEGSSRQFFPFFVDDQRVGVVPKFFVEILKRFPSTFIVDDALETTSGSRQNKASVSLHPDLKRGWTGGHWLWRWPPGVDGSGVAKP